MFVIRAVHVYTATGFNVNFIHITFNLEFNDGMVFTILDKDNNNNSVYPPESYYTSAC